MKPPLFYYKDTIEENIIFLKEGEGNEKKGSENWQKIIEHYDHNVPFINVYVAQLRIPDYPDGNSGGIRTLNRRHPDTLSINLILH